MIPEPMSLRTVVMLPDPERCMDCGGALVVRIDADLEQPCDCAMLRERRDFPDEFEPNRLLRRQAD